MSISITLFDFGRISGMQNVSLCNSAKQEKIFENNKTLPEKNYTDKDIKKLASYIRIYKKQSKLPSFEEINQKFNNGEFDPRNLKKGDVIIFSNCTVKIEKDGEFTCKVQGRDNTVRIYQGKDKWGRDCICMDYRYKKTEANIYFTYKVKTSVEEYDKKINK